MWRMVWSIMRRTFTRTCNVVKVNIANVDVAIAKFRQFTTFRLLAGNTDLLPVYCYYLTLLVFVWEG